MLAALEDGLRAGHAAMLLGEAAASPNQKMIAVNVPRLMLVRLEEATISPKVTSPATTKMMLPPTLQSVNICKNPRA